MGCAATRMSINYSTVDHVRRLSFLLFDPLTRGSYGGRSSHLPQDQEQPADLHGPLQYICTSGHKREAETTTNSRTHRSCGLHMKVLVLLLHVGAP